MKRTGKRMLAILLSMVLLLSGGTSLPLLAAAPTAGEGKFLAAIEAPLAESIPISTAAELDNIRDDLSGNYYLENDIVLSDWGNWDPIGDSDSNPFSGVFDGQGHVIYGLTVTGDVPYAGLFGFAADAVIKNVGMEDGRIDVSSSSAGGVVGCSSGSLNISNCYNTGAVSSSSSDSYYSFAGGIVGYNDGYNDSNSFFTISSCYNTGAISASCEYSAESSAGGVVGYSDNYNSSSFTISNCYNTGDVASSSHYSSSAGGVMGFSRNAYSSSFNMTNCYNTGEVTTTATTSSTTSSAGGVMGVSVSTSDGSSVTISNCYNTGDVSSDSDSSSSAGGVLGSSNGGNVTTSNCFNTGDVSSTTNRGFYGSNAAGGVVGDNRTSDHFTITDCYNTGNVSSYAFVYDPVSSSYDVDFTSSAGGVLGHNLSVEVIITISNCYNMGDVSSTALSANAFAGGVVGVNVYYASSSIEQCVVLSDSMQATGTNVSSYLVGPDDGSTKTNNRARNDISGNATNDADTLLALSEFKKQSTYTGLGWDFDTVWAISPDANNGYPYLQSIPPASAAPAALTGTATIDNTAPRIGDTLTASLAGGNNTGALTYTWKAGGTQVQTGAGDTYTVQTADLGKTLTLEITSSEQTGTRTSAATTAVTKKTVPAAPLAPTPVSKTATGVTLTPNDVYEFRRGSESWQTSNVFTDLTPNTAYTFYQRLAETADTLASGASAGLSVTTDLAPATVTGVTVSPAVIEVQAGGAQQFAATVTGTNNPSQDVTWSLEGNSETDTEIDLTTGLLTIDGNEAAETILTITATSTANPGISGTATVTVTTDAAAPLYAISLNTGNHTFPAATEGYGAPDTLTVTVTNTGNQDSGELTAALTGANPGSFALNDVPIADIAVGDDDSFTVTPNTGLTAGSYTATVTVSGDHGITASFNVSFTVSPAPPLTNDATLAALTLSAGTLTPVFNPATATYSASVANSVSSVTVTATANHPDADITGDGVKTLSVGANNVTITVTAADGITSKTYTLTVTRAQSSNLGGGSDGNDYSGGTSSSTTTGTTTTNTGNAAISYSQTGTTVTLTLPDSKITEIITKAETAATGTGTGTNTNTATAVLDLSGLSNAAAVTLPTNALTQLADAGLNVEIALTNGTITLSKETAANLASQANTTNISLTLATAASSSLNAAQSAAIKTGDLVFNITAQSGTQTITNYNGLLTATVPYSGQTPAAVWYLDSTGTLTALASTYNATTQTISFNLPGHFSLYVVGYNGPVAVTPYTPDETTSETSTTEKRTLTKADLTYIYGQNRVLTAVAISKQGWTTASTVVLAPGAEANLIDALAVAPLAYQENAPILLSVDNTIDTAVLAEIQRLGATKIIAVGALSDSLIDQLRTIFPNSEIEILRGADRFATAALINAKITNLQGTIVVGYNAIADAVSIASWAAANAYAIHIANPDGSATPPQYGSGNNDTTTTNYILGGPTLVQDLPGYTRIYGADRYATNLALRQALNFSNEAIYTADGNTLVDALTGSVLAAKTRSAIVLTPNNDPTGTDFGDITPETKAYGFGGAK